MYLIIVHTWGNGGVSIFYFVFWFLSFYGWMKLSSRYILSIKLLIMLSPDYKINSCVNIVSFKSLIKQISINPVLICPWNESELEEIKASLFDQGVNAWMSLKNPNTYIYIILKKSPMKKVLVICLIGLCWFFFQFKYPSTHPNRRQYLTHRNNDKT